jgi:8-oxo-dGTP pyrophosphatase MutT (NUDIX family)
LKDIICHAPLPKPAAESCYRPACVFLLLFEKTEPCLLAIQKSDTVGYRWRNQVALPGGHLDLMDACPMDAAFRELEEELNITRDQVEFIGSMGHFKTKNHRRDIEVFIGLWDGKGPVNFDSREIARILEIPFKDLVRTHDQHHYRGCNTESLDLRYPYKDVVIWGATARILHFFIELAYPFIGERYPGPAFPSVKE